MPSTSSSSSSLQDCISTCRACAEECQTTLYTHCLYEGGAHTAPEHLKLMTDCIQICQTAADCMTRGSSWCASVCSACADICEACAKSCESIDSAHMRSCAEACRACAQSCRETSGSSRLAA